MADHWRHHEPAVRDLIAEVEERAEDAEARLRRVEEVLDGWHFRESRFPIMREIDASLREALVNA